ncbi:MAG TPA: FtsX-like permease family protein [Pseudothermotoga sp.]
MRFKSVFVLIFGVGVPSMLLVGGLSLNDSVSRYIERSFSANFGAADAYVENRRNNIFFKMPLDQRIIDELKNKQEVSSVLPVTETFGRIEYDSKFQDCLVVGVGPDDLEKFVQMPVDLPKGGAIVSKDLAGFLSISEGDTITLNIGRGEIKFKVTQVGEKGFLNFRGENLNYAGTVFVDKDDLSTTSFPTRIYMSLKIGIEKHQSFAEKIQTEFGVSSIAMKSRLLNSPANKALGYLTVAFSGFSMIASFVLVYLFAQSFVEERNTTMVTLRILGMRAKHISLILILEGMAYLLVAGFTGGAIGIFLGNLLLRKLQTIVSIFMNNSSTSFSQFTLYVSPITVIIGVFAGLILPLLIFIFKIRSITQRPPVQMLRIQEQKVSSSVPFTINLLNLVAGVLLIIFIYLLPPTEPITAWKVLQRGIVIFLSSWLIFLPIISLLRKMFSSFSKKGSVSTFIALSYVDRHRKNTFIIALMFSLIIYMMVIVMTVPYNVERFLKEKLETGLFGYNFMAVYNPLKLVFAKGDISPAENLKDPAKVYIAQFEDDLIAFVDDNFLQKAIVSIETNTKWRKNLLQPNTIVVGYVAEEGKSSSTTVSGIVKSPFRIGESEKMNFEVIDTFDMRKVMVPVKYIASVNSLPRSVRAIPVILGKVGPQAVSQAKEFYAKRFDFSVYITEELNRLFSGVDLLVQAGVTLLYFGLMSGFSGIAFHALRSVIVRRRLSGTLRAIGVSSKSLGAAFILENMIVASIGIAVGVFAGLWESKDLMQLIFTLFGSGRFVFPIWYLFGMILAIYVVITVVVSLPAILTQKSPIEALRAPE